MASGPAVLVIRFEDNRETTYCVSYTEDVNLPDSYTDKVRNAFCEPLDNLKVGFDYALCYAMQQ